MGLQICERRHIFQLQHLWPFPNSLPNIYDSFLKKKKKRKEIKYNTKYEQLRIKKEARLLDKKNYAWLWIEKNCKISMNCEWIIVLLYYYNNFNTNSTKKYLNSVCNFLFQHLKIHH